MSRYSSTQIFSLGNLTSRIHLRKGWAFGLMIIGALVAFEIFNYSTTDFALTDLLGDASFMSLKWSTILALAFCGIDFAGIARLFTPEQGADEPAEVWYLFGAWLLAASMNALLTWWGVSIAILEHQTLGNAVVARETLLKVVPIFVAILVWLSRVLIIGTFSIAGDRLINRKERSRALAPTPSPFSRVNTTSSPVAQSSISRPRANGMQSGFSATRQAPKRFEPEHEELSALNRPEPTYHPIGMRSRTENGSTVNFR